MVGGMLENAYPSAWEEVGSMTAFEAAQRIKAAILSLERDTRMIGSVVAVLRDFLHVDMLPMDGGTYDRADYPDLYDVLPLTYQTTGTTFTLPDMRDLFVTGANGAYGLGATGGANDVTLSIGQMPSHSHDTLPHSHGESGAIPSLADLGTGVPVPSATPTPTITASSGVTVLSTGGGLAHENRPPFIALTYAIIAR